MTRPRVLTSLLLALVLGVAVVPLRASDPVGIYCMINRVALEPNETEPLTIQIWGAFAFSGGIGNGNTYGPVAKGYLYYSCPKGREGVCLSEWADLKALAGKDEVIGFGDRYRTAPGRLRKADEPAASPDPYPINIGVVKMGHPGGGAYPDLVKALHDAMKGR